METQYVKQYSPALDRDMECKIYGRAGRPVLYIPCQDGRFFDFESFRLTDTWAPWIESGKAMVFSIDTMTRRLGPPRATPAGGSAAMSSGCATSLTRWSPLCGPRPTAATAGPGSRG